MGTYLSQAMAKYGIPDRTKEIAAQLEQQQGLSDELQQSNATNLQNNADFKHFEASQPEATVQEPISETIGRGLGTIGLALGKGATKIGALAEDAVMAPYDLVMGKVNPDYENNPYVHGAFPRSRSFGDLWDTTTEPVSDAVGLKRGTTAENIITGIGEFIPSLMVSGGLTKATGLIPEIEGLAAKASSKLGGKFLGKSAESIIKQSPDMVNTWLMMEAPKPEEERTPFPEWAAMWAGGELAVKGIGLAGKGMANKLGKGATKIEPVSKEVADGVNDLVPDDPGMDFPDDIKIDFTVEPGGRTHVGDPQLELPAGEQRLMLAAGKQPLQLSAGKDAPLALEAGKGEVPYSNIPNWRTPTPYETAMAIERQRPRALTEPKIDYVVGPDGKAVAKDTVFPVAKIEGVDYTPDTALKGRQRIAQDIDRPIPRSDIGDPAYLSELEGRYNSLVGNEVARMKDELGGVVRYMPDEQNGPLLRASLNPPWYQKFWKINGRPPREGEYRDMAIKNLIEGNSETGVPADDEFNGILSELARGQKLPEEWHGLQKSIGEMSDSPELEGLVGDMVAAQKTVEPSGLVKSLDRLTEIENKARQGMKDYMDFRKQYPDAVGIVSKDAEFVKNAVILGAVKVAKQGIKYAEWSKAMLSEIPGLSEKQLAYIWHRSQELITKGATNLKIGEKEVPVSLGDTAKLGKGATTPIFPAGVKGKNVVPGPGSGIMEESQFKTNTLTNSEFLQDPDVQKVIQDAEMLYEVKPNEQSIQRASDMVQKDFWGTVDRISNEGLQGAEDAVASGIITNAMRKDAQATGDYTQVTKWLKTVQPKVTEVAQTLQALSTWKSMTVDGALNMAARTINTENELLKKAGRSQIELTPDDVKYITEQMSKVESMPETTAEEIRAKEIEFAKVKGYIADKVPASLAEKIKGLQRIMMLLNPKTIVSRNTLGNTILGGFETLKDVPGALVDMGVSKLTGERTTLIPSIEGMQTLGKGARRGFKEVTEDIRAGVDTSPTRGQYELPAHRVFDNSVLNGLDQATTRALQYGDRPFFQAAYDESLRQQMKIAKVEVPTDAMKQRAMDVAKDRTFQNDSRIAKGVEQLRGGLNNIVGTEEFGLGNVVLPFSKTPANILDKAIDYSPIGFMKAGLEAGLDKNKGMFNQKKFVDTIGRAMTGTGVIMLGYDLAKKGVITGNSDKDADVRETKKGLGINPFSINTGAIMRLFRGEDVTPQKGDVFQTYDWAQPISVGLAIGADLAKSLADRKEASNVLYETLKSGGNTLLNQSVLQGVQKMVGGYDAMAGVLDTLFEFPLQFVPSVSGQVARVTDDKARETYDPSLFQTIVNKGKTKIPGLRNDMHEKVDTLGRPVDSVAGGNSLLNTFLNPGTTQAYNPTPAQEMIMDIYNKSGEKIQFPRLVEKTVNGQQLTPQQLEDYQRYVGTETAKRFDQLANNPSFRGMKPEKQAEKLQSIMTEINKKGIKLIGAEAK